MATKKCIGVREDTGDPCKRPAGSRSDFCFAHRPQEGNEKILNLQHDPYHCPDDGQKLWYVPRLKLHRCGMCDGVLLNEKEIDPLVLESVLGLSKVAEEGLAVECPTCSTDSDLSDGKFALSNFAMEWGFSVQKSKYHSVYYCGVSNVGHCKVCGSTWFAGPGERDALGKNVGKERGFWRVQPGGSKIWGPLDMQQRLREERLRLVARKTEKRERMKEKLCQHVDSNGERCNRRKTQKEGSEYCFKHRPK